MYRIRDALQVLHFGDKVREARLRFFGHSIRRFMDVGREDMLRTGRDERRRFSLVAPRKKLDKAKKKN